MLRARQAPPPYRVDMSVAGHDLVGDEPPDNGGQNVGAAPFDYVLAGLAACTLITLRMYAERKNWAGFDISAQLRHRVEDRVHQIQRDVEVSGVPDDAGLERLRDIVERTPVTLALKPGFTISTVIRQAAPGAA
ncbi:MAG TPA: OsmC family protein [Caulobacteraceae bacterium]|jgi:putative redox protein|nr:OsmC family protein [Caulobacteraceae bacterium]